jgi:hypothetical protein
VCVLVPASHVDFESKNEKKFRDVGQVRLQIHQGKDVLFRVNPSVSGFVVCCLVRKPNLMSLGALKRLEHGARIPL